MTKRTNLISLCIIVLLLSACSERFTAYYPKYEDALKAGAIKRGWIPEIIPKTATDIHEQHDIDTNEVWIRFDLPSADKNRLMAGMRKLTDREILNLRVGHPSRADWWFENLIQQQPANNNALNAEIYVVKCREDKNGYMAFDHISQMVYYWCP